VKQLEIPDQTIFQCQRRRPPWMRGAGAKASAEEKTFMV